MVLTLADSIHNVNPNFPGEVLLQSAVTGRGSTFAFRELHFANYCKSK